MPAMIAKLQITEREPLSWTLEVRGGCQIRVLLPSWYTYQYICSRVDATRLDTGVL